MNKRIKIYSLYEINEHGDTKFRGRFTSKVKVRGAAIFLKNYFIEVEEKFDEFA
jgi:hypothetical protein